jgi:hypothetical protein
MKLFQRKERYAQTQEGFDAQVEAFLFSEGFPVTQEFKSMFSALVQHAPETQDFFYPRHVASMMRKLKVNEFAFFNMYPEKRPKPKEEKSELQEATTDVVPEA